MNRSPLAYPLNRGVDGDAGGAADLQTDVMRFMAILGLCLVAIFALVQSIPLAPEAVTQPQSIAAPPAPDVRPPDDAQPEIVESPPELAVALPEPEAVVLTRPKWRPKAIAPPVPQPRTEPESQTTAAPQPEPDRLAAAPAGFTLRFESNLALTRLVAANQVGFYAIAAGRSQRMTVSDSRVSFWDASTPNSFHQMETATVPAAVVDALVRSGTDSAGVDWGVTLSGKLSRQLDIVMRENSGGSLVIGFDGELRLEST